MRDRQTGTDGNERKERKTEIERQKREERRGREIEGKDKKRGQREWGGGREESGGKLLPIYTRKSEDCNEEILQKPRRRYE